ncbi:hypothetical protein MI149_30160 (plasmid) [Mycolicibacterium crocinum]|uniref:Uncharacterized protein n=1 Tax=Mycolicibacterium crocinum TaxID=388459 RepID=A0ABY3TXH3_9MYCO|nr:hypothetical protein [Mycolicibacterium crocinum]ULN44760.1 hypothetical protein MI149_30160 [Mycolicibacterium crocinum]
MITRRTLLSAGTVDQKAGAAAAGRSQHQGHSAVLAAAWIETLNNRAERNAERHLRPA